MSERKSPQSNRAQNRQFDGARHEAERKLGRKLSRAERRRIHDDITKQDLSYDEIVNLIVGWFEDKDNGNKR
jgi:hypothetical protein